MKNNDQTSRTDGPAMMEAEQFRETVAKADECDHLAQKYQAAGKRSYAEHYRRCADDFRREACGFNWRDAHDEFWQTRDRVSVGLTADAMEALESLGIEPKRRARYLAGLLSEAICARAAVGKEGATLHRLEVRPGVAHTEQRYHAHMAATAAAEFAICRAMHEAETAA